MIQIAKEVAGYLPMRIVRSLVNSKTRQGSPISEFVGLITKIYTLLIEGRTQKMTAKGVESLFKEKSDS